MKNIDLCWTGTTVVIETIRDVPSVKNWKRPVETIECVFTPVIESLSDSELALRDRFEDTPDDYFTTYSLISDGLLPD